MDAAWGALARELDAWGAAGRVATLWLRDDDACRASPALDRLLATAGAHAVPVTVAAIPAGALPDLAERLAAAPHATLVQHGLAHRNHAPAGERSCELGAHRPAAVVAEDLAAGLARLRELACEARLGARGFLPVLVPPWNRIDPAVVGELPRLGFTGLSAFGPRARAWAGPGVLQCNTHVDLVAWRRERAFIGTAAALGRLIGHLEARRRGAADADEATGVLTHHLVMTDPAWEFLAALLAATAAHRAAAWLPAPRIFGTSERDEPA